MQTVPTSINQSWDPETAVCSPPLGSPTVSQKRSYVHVSVVSQWSLSAVLPVRWCPWGVPGWVYWVGNRVGNTGVYYPATQLLALRSVPAVQRPQGAGPPCRGGWYGSRVGPTPSRTMVPGASATHPCGARPLLPAPLGRGLPGGSSSSVGVEN